MFLLLPQCCFITFHTEFHVLSFSLSKQHKCKNNNKKSCTQHNSKAWNLACVGEWILNNSVLLEDNIHSVIPLKKTDLSVFSSHYELQMVSCEVRGICVHFLFSMLGIYLTWILYVRPCSRSLCKFICIPLLFLKGAISLKFLFYLRLT